MGPRIQVFLLLVCIQFSVIAAITDPRDSVVLQSLRSGWQNTPPTWRRQDPCSNWDGIGCVDSRVTSITLSSIGLTGQLSSDITALSELQILDLSYNTELTGTLPPSIGDLKKLVNLILIGCSFHGPIPDSIGSLPQLYSLSINLNRFSGSIPPSIGNLSKLFWLDLADNQLTGQIPISDGTSSGLDMLINTRHFHLGNNQLSGEIPDKLFNSDMALIHVLFENNSLTGMIPSSLGLARNLEVIRFDRNSITGPVPQTLSSLTRIQELFLSNNKLNGSIPSLAGMNFLSNMDMSNNSFNASEVLSWFSSLQSLTALTMENTQLQGQVPPVLFSLPNLQTVVFKNNNLSGTLNISTSNSNQLQFIDLLNNSISDFPGSAGAGGIDIILADNPICETYKPPRGFEPYFFIANPYPNFAGDSIGSNKSTSIGIIIGAAVGGSVLLFLVLLAGVYAYRQKRKAERATDRNQNPFASWDPNKNNGSIPEVKGTRSFSFEELSKYSNKFSDDIGSGGYGKFSVIAATTDPREFGVLQSIRNGWQNTPPTWRSQDPCSNWDGIECVDSRVTSITLSSIGLTGQLSSDITDLSELQILDLSYNTELTGTLPPSIGDLKKLTNLLFENNSLTGMIPSSLGLAKNLEVIRFDRNSITGPVPRTLSSLTSIQQLFLSNNKLNGSIPSLAGMNFLSYL
ncbi:hypothetical protein Q3G72_020289 [Acer saccharum]|nr:hypothetical protein Q3G72_020289 [Acer saccharum]